MRRGGELQDTLVMNDDRNTYEKRRMIEIAITLGKYCRKDTGNTYVQRRHRKLLGIICTICTNISSFGTGMIFVSENTWEFIVYWE